MRNLKEINKPKSLELSESEANSSSKKTSDIYIIKSQLQSQSAGEEERPFPSITSELNIISHHLQIVDGSSSSSQNSSIRGVINLAITLLNSKDTDEMGKQNTGSPQVASLVNS